MTIYSKAIYAIAISTLLSLTASSYIEPSIYPTLGKLKSFIKTGKFSRFSINNDGIEQVMYNGELHTNPVSISQNVIYTSEKIISSQLNPNISLLSPSKSLYKPKESSNQDIIKTADFLIDNYHIENINSRDVVRYSYNFDYDSYKLKAPWYSGMAQGHVAIVLISAYLLTEDMKYLDYAKKSINLLEIPVQDGGVLVRLGPDQIWFEEYSSNSLSRDEYPLVLNGNLFAIDGVFLLYSITHEQAYLNLLKNSLLALERSVSKYDSNHWSYYDSKGNYAHVGYHKLHIKQLNRAIYYSKLLNLGSTTNLENALANFKRYDRFPMLGYIQRMFYQRNNMVYAIFIPIFIFILSITSILIFRKQDANS